MCIRDRCFGDIDVKTTPAHSRVAVDFQYQQADQSAKHFEIAKECTMVSTDSNIREPSEPSNRSFIRNTSADAKARDKKTFPIVPALWVEAYAMNDRAAVGLTK